MDIIMSAADYNLVLETVDLPPELAELLRAGAVEGLFLRFPMSEEAGIELLIAVTNTAAGCSDRKSRRSLARLAGKLDDQLTRAGVRLDIDPVAMLRSQDAHNRTPRDEFGGFTPEQLHILFSNDWSAETPGLHLREDAPPELLDASRVLHNARVMLAALADDGAKATTAGNLNRASVGDMLAAMRWRDGFIKDLHRWNKVINEQDAWPLHDLRVVLELAGLVRVHKGRFVPTRKGRELEPVDQAGVLLALLVSTTFRTFNLGYHDRLPEMPTFQDTIAFPLAVLSREPDDWREAPTLFPRLLLPAVAEMLPHHDLMDFRKAMIRLRLIERLEALGLVECRRETHSVTYHLDEITHVRRTPLFGWVFGFDFDGGGGLE